MKIASLIYVLFLTLLDLFLIYSYDFHSPTLLICIIGAASVFALGLLFPINSFLTKVLVTSVFSVYAVYINEISTQAIILFLAFLIHSAALWFEAEKFGSGSRWTEHYKVTHRLRHQWFGSLGFLVGLAVSYLLVRDFYNFPEHISIGMILLAAVFTLMYLEVNRTHNQSIIWVDISGPLLKSFFYWRLIALSAILLFGVFWFASTPVTDYLIEVRESFDKDDNGKSDNDDDPMVRAPGTRSGFSPGDVVLTSKVDISLSEKPEFYLKVESLSQLRRLRNKPLYVSAQELIYYSGNIWKPENIEVLWFRDEEDGKKDGNISLERPHKYNVRHSIYLLRKGASSVFSLSGLNTIELPEVFLSSMGVLGMRQGDAEKRKKYTVNSNFYNYNSINKGSLKVGQAEVKYRQLPMSEMAKKLRNLTFKIVRPQDSDLQKIVRIKSFLERNCKYSLKVNNPQNRSPLDNFLFYERKGHCVLFATAYTLMLRAAGIPARMVNGFAGGDYDIKKGVYVMKSSHAHAWTEIYFQNYGWVVCDPTPEAENIAPGVTDAEGFEESEFEDMSTFVSTENAAKEKSFTFFSNIKNVLLSLVMALVLLSFVWQYLKKIPGMSFINREKKRPEYKRPEYILAYEEYCRSRGVNTGKSKTVRELLADLMKSGEDDPDLLQMVNYYYDVTFAGLERSEVKEGLWLSLINKKLK